jgi:hypothetical protein
MQKGLFSIKKKGNIEKVQTFAYIKDTSTWDLVSFVGKI